MHKKYDPIALYSEQNNYLGVAYFSNLDECLRYKARYEEKLIRRYLYEDTKRRKKIRPNATGAKFQRLRSAGDIKIFCEPEIPQLHH
jgi:hypothetical protein